MLIPTMKRSGSFTDFIAEPLAAMPKTSIYEKLPKGNLPKRKRLAKIC
jgi:hypothetical protein